MGGPNLNTVPFPTAFREKGRSDYGRMGRDATVIALNMEARGFATSKDQRM